MKDPEWARISGIDDVEWSIECDGRDSAIWDRLDRAPRTGERAVIVSHQPLPSARFWALFQPALSSLNGWEEYPEEIAQSCLLDCAIDNDLGRRNWDHRENWQAIVCIKDAIALADLVHRFPPVDEGAIPALPPHRAHLRTGDFTLLTGDLEGDVSGYLLLVQSRGVQSLVLHGEFVFGESRFIAGNRLYR